MRHGDSAMYFYVDRVAVDGPKLEARFNLNADISIGGVSSSVAGSLLARGFRSHQRPQFSGCIRAAVAILPDATVLQLLQQQRLRVQPTGSVRWGTSCGLLLCSDWPDHCYNGGTCYEVNIGQSLGCRCRPGYSGRRCLQRPQCPDNFCSNGATCSCSTSSDSTCSPVCACRPGFTGRRCEIATTCPSGFCYNGGTCRCNFNSDGGCAPQCSCPLGYSGPRCLTRLQCDPSTCGNGGTCYCDPSELRNGRCVSRCRCARYYTGPRCQQFNCLDLLNNCNSRGVCRCSSAANCRCSCWSGFSGDRCEIVPPRCQDYDCRNGGLCRVTDSRRFCDCSRSGFLPDDRGLCTRTGVGFLLSAKLQDKLRPFPQPGGFYVLPLPSTAGRLFQNLTVGFQTFRPDGTILAFNASNGAAWAVELEGGYLKVNWNGIRHLLRLPSGMKLNDGQYHVLHLQSLGTQLRAYYDGDELSSIYVGDQLSADQITFGANSAGKLKFSGLIGNFRWNGRAFDRSQYRESGKLPSSSHVQFEKIPAQLMRPETCSSQPGFCQNSGICQETLIGLSCKCVQPFYGRTCTHRPWGILVSAGSNRQLPDCAGLVMTPAVSGSPLTEKFAFRFQTYQTKAVLLTVQNSRGQYWQLYLKDGRLHWRDSIGLARLRVAERQLNEGEQHSVMGSRSGSSLQLSVDAASAAAGRSFQLRGELLDTGAAAAKVWQYGSVHFGAGSFPDADGVRLCFVGAIGAMQWNDMRLVESGGRLHRTAIVRPSSLKLIEFPTDLSKTIAVLPLVPGGGGGSSAANGGVGIGAGGTLLNPGSDGEILVNEGGASVVAAVGGGGASSLASAGFGAAVGSVNAWAAGLLLALLLLVSSILWACCHCKPGYCLCCAKQGAAGYAAANSTDEPPLSPVNGANFSRMQDDIEAVAVDQLATQKRMKQLGNDGDAVAKVPLFATGTKRSSLSQRSLQLHQQQLQQQQRSENLRAQTLNVSHSQAAQDQIANAKQQFSSAFATGRRRRRREMNGSGGGAVAGGGSVTDGGMALFGSAGHRSDIQIVDRTTLDTRAHLQGGQIQIQQQQQQQQLDTMSVRSVPFHRSEFGHSSHRQQHQQLDAMSDVYRPRQVATIGHDRVLDLNSSYHIESMGANTSAMHEHHDAENVFLSESIKVDCVIMTQNSRYVVTGNATGPAQVWDCGCGDLIKVMDGVDVGCTEIHLACGDTVLLGMVLDESAGKHKLQMWDFAHGRQIAMPVGTYCSAVTVNRTGAQAVIASMEADDCPGPLLVWDISSNQPLRSLPLPVPQEEAISFLQVSREDQFVVAGFENQENSAASYLVYDLSLPVGTQPIQVDFDALLTSTELGAGEAVTATIHGELLVWALGSGQIERPIIHANGVQAHSSAIKAACWSDDGRILLSAGSDMVVRVWDMTDESLRFEMEGHTEEVQTVCISHDTELAVSAGLDGSIRVWKLTDGTQLCWFTSNIEILKVLLSRDKRCLAALGERSGNRKLIMLQILRSKSRRTRNRGGAADNDNGHATLA